jgi:ssDNA thymidine ADP-ribosyltransferase, DarT
MSKDLNPDKALIFRITHRDNLPWILANGLYCANSPVRDPNFVTIGNADLINKRALRTLPLPFDGTLSDYVPFYFTPFSPMMYNIKTGWGGIQVRENAEIIILVSSIWKLRKEGIPFLFSDRHAYLKAARFFDDTAQLNQIDWQLLQRRDFKRDPNDPAKLERYEAETLVRTHVPVKALLGVTCYDLETRDRITQAAEKFGVTLKTVVQPSWYFQ